MPSLQLARYLEERAAGGSVADACFVSGIDAVEAELHEADIASGALELPEPSRARARGKQPKEIETMEDVQTSIRVGDGPEVPINLSIGLDAPENAEAKEQIGSMFAKPATDTGQKLKLFIERVEHLEEEIKGLNDDKSDVYQEAKSQGFDTTTIKRIVKLRKMDATKRQEAEALLSTYMDAIGMTPIEQAIALAA